MVTYILAFIICFSFIAPLVGAHFLTDLGIDHLFTLCGYFIHISMATLLWRATKEMFIKMLCLIVIVGCFLFMFNYIIGILAAKSVFEYVMP